jgi:hypothetical protein
LSQKERALATPIRSPVRPSADAPTEASSSSADLDEATVTVVSSDASPSTSTERKRPAQPPEVIAAAGAANTPAAESRVDEWLGVYRGDDSTIFKMPDQPERRFDDAKASITVEAATGSKLSFHLVDSSNGKDICSLSATVEGSMANIEAGQPCFLDSDEGMSVKSRPGKATRRHRRLIFDLVLDTSMETEAGTVEGSIVYHFDGQR